METRRAQHGVNNIMKLELIQMIAIYRKMQCTYVQDVWVC